MIIKNIKGINFKNYPQVELSPSPYCNVLYGNNGSGKTNFLDLLHFSALGKSYFSISDKMAIRYNEDYFRIESELVKENELQKYSLAISVPAIGKKKIWHNDVVITKNTDILGLVPIVAVVPGDIQLIKGGSTTRRKFMDRILCQIDQNYTECLIKYKRALQHKLAIFKNSKNVSEIDNELLTTYDRMLYDNGKVLFQARKDFIETFLPIFLSTYQYIAEHKESVSISYKSNFDKDKFFDHVKSNLENDFYSKRVRIGIHRDDLNFLVGERELRKFGSQGQIKTFIYALKLTEYLYLSRHTKTQAILLLDDIFEKLDSLRLRKLFELVISAEFGQIFITDTEQKRSSAALKELNVDFLSYNVQNNSLTVSNG